MERVVAMERSLFTPSVLFSLLGLAAVAGLALRSVKKAPGIFFGIGWFFIALLPYMNWFPLNAEMAEHWLYLPSAGFFFLLATVIIKTGERYRTLTASLLIIILAAWAILTVDRNRDWKDNISIYRQTARLSPESPRAHYNLGNLYLSRGDYRSAVRSLRRALAIKPRDFKSRRGLGKALLGMGEPLPAVAALQAAVSLRPSSAAALSELGVAYSLAGSDEKAVSALRSALEIDPFSARAHNNLASAYTRLGAFSEALTACNRALELNPDLLEARFNRGVILYHLGETEKARAQFRRVIRDDPAFRPARIWLEDTRPPDQTFF